MSHHSEEALFTPGTDSFWEPGNYKRTVKRTEDGFRLCNDLIQLITERAEIEKVYAKNLKTWTKKWAELIEKGPEYGTAEAAWKSVLEEADRRSDIHLSVKDKLLNDVVASIKQWQKDSYHKSMMHIKEKKEFEDNFKKVCLAIIASCLLLPAFPLILHSSAYSLTGSPVPTTTTTITNTTTQVKLILHACLPVYLLTCLPVCVCVR